MNYKSLPSDSKLRLPFREDDSRAWALIACAIFLLRVMPWSMAELWYDEVLTLLPGRNLPQLYHGQQPFFEQCPLLVVGALSRFLLH